MEKDLIRLLRAEEIECRIAMVNEKGLSLLLYKDARVDQRILDETFGAFGWKRSHQCIDGNLYCTVEILDRESGEWISKQDVGTTGYTEKENPRHRTASRGHASTGGLGVSCIRHRSSGFRQLRQASRRKAIDTSLMSVSR